MGSEMCIRDSAWRARRRGAAMRAWAEAACGARGWRRRVADALRALAGGACLRALRTWLAAAHFTSALRRGARAMRAGRSGAALRGWRLGVRVRQLAALSARRMRGGTVAAIDAWHRHSASNRRHATALRRWRGGGLTRALARWRVKRDGMALGARRRRRAALRAAIDECRALAAQVRAAVGDPRGFPPSATSGDASSVVSSSADGVTRGRGAASWLREVAAPSERQQPWAQRPAVAEPASPPRWLSHVPALLSPAPLFDRCGALVPAGAPPLDPPLRPLLAAAVGARAPAVAAAQPRADGRLSLGALRREAAMLEATFAPGGAPAQFRAPRASAPAVDDQLRALQPLTLHSRCGGGGSAAPTPTR